MDRRALLLGGAAFAGSAMIVGGGALTYGAVLAAGDNDTGDFLITRSDAEWRSMLTRTQYKVMRKRGTERAGSSLLYREKSPGTYRCRGCNLAVYSSDAKYDSGTGWPCFYEALPNSVATRRESTWFTQRTEVHCRRCGSHLGQIFDDGPPPTGKRHSINGVSLKFIPESEADMFLRRHSRRVLKA